METIGAMLAGSLGRERNEWWRVAVVYERTRLAKKVSMSELISRLRLSSLQAQTHQI